MTTRGPSDQFRGIDEKEPKFDFFLRNEDVNLKGRDLFVSGYGGSVPGKLAINQHVLTLPSLVTVRYKVCLVQSTVELTNCILWDSGRAGTA